MFIDSETIEAIEASESAFCDLVTHFGQDVLGRARLFPRFSKPRLIEIYGAWRNDMQRVGEHERMLEEGLDHFKRAGHLAFWLRRFTPLVEAVDLTENPSDPPGYGLTTAERDFRDVLFGYSNEYLAFDLGYQFCLFYERGRSPPNIRAQGLILSHDYIGMMCHFMKYKTVSPHAMAMIYKSLFLEFGMTAKRTRRPKDEDEAQSRRFLDLAHELEAKGELDPDEDGQALDNLVRQTAPQTILTHKPLSDGLIPPDRPRSGRAMNKDAREQRAAAKLREFRIAHPELREEIANRVRAGGTAQDILAALSVDKARGA